MLALVAPEDAAGGLPPGTSLFCWPRKYCLVPALSSPQQLNPSPDTCNMVFRQASMCTCTLQGSLARCAWVWAGWSQRSCSA